LKFVDLKNCLSNLVQQGGLKDGESCVIVSWTREFLVPKLEWLMTKLRNQQQGLSITGVSEVTWNTKLEQTLEPLKDELKPVLFLIIMHRSWPVFYKTLAMESCRRISWIYSLKR
jgi:hypothetical protein